MQAAVTKAASYSAPDLIDLKTLPPREMIVTLDITAAERDTADETYDFYITTGDGKSSWDVVHFPQIASTGAKRYTARILTERLAEVTTATPGVAAEPSGTFATVTAGAGEGIRTLGAGKVRHGPLGNLLGYELVIAGTVATGIAYSIQVQTR